jgi:hypothetical protein
VAIETDYKDIDFYILEPITYNNPEMEFLNGNFGQGQNLSLHRIEFLSGFLKFSVLQNALHE